MTRKVFYEGNILQLRNHSFSSTFEKKSTLPATSVLSQQQKRLAYNTTASMDKPVYNNYINFKKFQDWFLVQKQLQLLACKTQCF